MSDSRFPVIPSVSGNHLLPLIPDSHPLRGESVSWIDRKHPESSKVIPVIPHHPLPITVSPLTTHWIALLRAFDSPPILSVD